MPGLRRRTVTAVVYGAVVLVAVLAPPIVFWTVLAVVAVLGLRELAAMRTGPSSVAVGVLFLAGLVALGVLRSYGSTGSHHAIAGQLPVWLFLVLVPTWAADVAAYMGGSIWGTHKLAPRISPGKTWEGTIVGFVACFVAAFGVGATFGLGRAIVAIVAIGLGPVGLGGDLAKSYVKRRAGVKDSGTLLPGHGGIIDRLDSTVAGAVFVLVVFLLGTAAGLG